MSSTNSFNSNRNNSSSGQNAAQLNRDEARLNRDAQLGQQQGIGLQQASGLQGTGAQQLNQQQGVLLSGNLPPNAVIGNVVTEQPIQETIYKPSIVEEVVRNDTLIEIQPVITRHVEQPVVHHIEQHVYQPAAPLGASTVTAAPIVNEIIHPHVINEVQEVIHKEVPIVQIQKVEEFREETIVLPTQHSNEVVQGSVQGFNQTPQGLNSNLQGQGQPGLARQGVQNQALQNQELAQQELQSQGLGQQGIPLNQNQPNKLTQDAEILATRNRQAGGAQGTLQNLENDARLENRNRTPNFIA